MRVLGLLQNQWARNPAAVLAMFARRPEYRHDLIRRMLAQSKAGRTLRAVFGDEVDRIVWENASPRVAGTPNGSFSYDVKHVNAAIANIKPDVVIAFGVQAKKAIMASCWTGPTITAPHPTASSSNVGKQLCEARTMLSRARLEIEATAKDVA